jgi:hypothetical protein
VHAIPSSSNPHLASEDRFDLPLEALLGNDVKIRRILETNLELGTILLNEIEINTCSSNAVSTIPWYEDPCMWIQACP